MGIYNTHIWSTKYELISQSKYAILAYGLENKCWFSIQDIPYLNSQNIHTQFN
jgi:hypothetical protein